MFYIYYLLSVAHEYCKVEGNVATIGITDFAQSALGDIVFVDLPEIATTFSVGDSFGSVESVKAASDVYAPISGKVTAVNDVLSDEPGLVNSSPEDEAWFIKMEINSVDGETELKKLLNAEEYKAHCEKEAH
jgi:glycine cleavage system H protein